MIVTAAGAIRTVDDITPLVRPTIAFPQWTIDTAQSVVDVPGWLIANRRFYLGDHWQDQMGWVGPHPRYGDEDFVRGWEEIARCFTSENVIKAIVDRRATGVIGREPMWKLTPRNPVDDKGKASPEDERLIKEAVDFLTPWWNERAAHERMYEWLTTILSGYRGALRMFVPPGLYQPATVNGVAVRALRQASNPEEALKLLYLAALPPERATVYENPDTMQAAGVYLYATDTATAMGGQQRAEVSWVDPASGRTFVRTLGAGIVSAAPTILNLGGRLPMFQAEYRPFITEQLRQLQRAYNLALTLLPHNLVTGGWLEMIVTGGQMPGHFKRDENGKPTDEWVPHEMPRGASYTQWIAAQQYGKLADGSTQLTNPAVQFRPPSDVSGVISSHESLYTRMLDAASQVHILMSQDGTASGRSREVARGEFRQTLTQPGARAQRAGRWLIESALAHVELLTGQPGKYTSRLRCEFTCRYDLGPLAADERAANVADVEAGLLSDAEAMERNNVEDVDAMRAEIQSSERGQLGLSTEQADAVQKWLDTGLSYKGALMAARIDDELSAKLLAEYEGPPPAPEMGVLPGQPGANGNRRPPVPVAAQ